MLFKSYFGSIVCSVVMIVLGAAMAAVGMFVASLDGAPFTYALFMQTWGAAFVFNYIAALILPAAKWADGLCALCKLKPGSLPFALLNTLVLNTVFVTVVTLGMMTVNVGFNAMFFPAFLKIYPIMFVCGYIVSFFVGLAGAKLAAKIVGKQ